ncbi:hypothetical protein GEMRC1_012482 [Eukaryota sp. GEM-RC1]
MVYNFCSVSEKIQIFKGIKNGDSAVFDLIDENYRELVKDMCAINPAERLSASQLIQKYFKNLNFQYEEGIQLSVPDHVQKSYDSNIDSQINLNHQQSSFRSQSQSSDDELSLLTNQSILIGFRALQYFCEVIEFNDSWSCVFSLCFLLNQEVQKHIGHLLSGKLSEDLKRAFRSDTLLEAGLEKDEDLFDRVENLKIFIDSVDEFSVKQTLDFSNYLSRVCLVFFSKISESVTKESISSSIVDVFGKIERYISNQINGEQLS